VATLGREAFLGAYVTNLLRYTARHHPRARPVVGWGLRFALMLRMTVRPARFGEYRAALRAVKTATPGAPTPPPPAAGVR
jgi:hypothetical protein